MYGIILYVKLIYDQMEKHQYRNSIDDKMLQAESLSKGCHGTKGRMDIDHWILYLQTKMKSCKPMDQRQKIDHWIL